MKSSPKRLHIFLQQKAEIKPTAQIQIFNLSKMKEKTGILKGGILGSSFRTPISVEMQADLRFELELVAVCTALKNTLLLGLWIRIKEQQKLFVQKPEHKPGNTAFGLSHISALRAPEAPSNRATVLRLPALMRSQQASHGSTVNIHTVSY